MSGGILDKRPVNTDKPSYFTLASDDAIEIVRQRTEYGEMFCIQGGGLATNEQIQQVVPDTEYEEVECPYCGEMDLRPIDATGFWTCSLCGAS